MVTLFDVLLKAMLDAHIFPLLYNLVNKRILLIFDHLLRITSIQHVIN